MNPLANQILSIFLLVFGFGFVIFFHELGHFLAAKWVGIRVEQFAVGFGQALLSWRKGLGVRAGSTNKELERVVAGERSKTDEKIDRNAVGELQQSTETDDQILQRLGIGETEYRLNWIPLGGYVKMLGQDDLKPNAKADDPRAYNRKSIGARMVVVSAGVIMNIILAAIGFMVVFLIGFNAPPSIVGGIVPGSPAQKAGLQVGDRILYLDDKYQHDFTKIKLNTALLEEGAPIPMYVKRVDGTFAHLTIEAARPDNNRSEFLMLGVKEPGELRGIEKRDLTDESEIATDLVLPEMRAVRPGEEIVAINGERVNRADYYKLDRALQDSNGKPVQISVKVSDGAIRTETVRPQLERMFNTASPNFGGLIPRTSVDAIDPASPARGKLMPGDAIVAIRDPQGDGQKSNPTTDELISWLSGAGRNGKAVNITVMRGDKEIEIKNLTPNVKVSKDPERYGLKIGLGYDENHPVVAGVAAGGPFKPEEKNNTVVSINGKPVATWFDVKTLLADVKPGEKVAFVFRTPQGDEHTVDVTFNQEELAETKSLRYTHSLLLHERVEPRKTSNPLRAAAWGCVETRDFILQFYLTLKRMFQGSVSYTNMMGPVGIFHAGTKFAYKGTDWLIWFLAMISANLAVVNFLPIPIVDGGLFTFLILEKIMGKPLSPKAQSIAQVVGLALILGVFLLVTVQDISRFL